MSESVVPVRRTAITMADYVRAVVRCWPKVGTGVPREESVAVLYAQYMIETGGAACWNYNVGNAKHFRGDGHNYHMLSGVWEGATPAEAARAIASGEAVADTNASHIKAVGSNRVSIVFQPPHPQTHFRAFASLDEGMGEHLQLLAKRFAKAWPAVLEGDFASFAELLKSQGYFTASAEAYAAGMRAPFAALVSSTTYEELVATMNAPLESVPTDVAAEYAVLWDREGELANLVTTMHDGASRLILEDMPRSSPREV